MKLYVVTAGCYSDYHIVGIFESEENAKLYIELNSKDPQGCWDEDMEYHCYETLDDRLMDANDSRNLYSVEIYPDTGKMKVEGVYWNHLTPDPDYAKFRKHQVWDWKKSRDVTVHSILVLANDEDL